MATILLYTGIGLGCGILIIGLITIYTDPEQSSMFSSIPFYVGGFWVAIIITVVSMFLPADKLHYEEKIDVYDLVAQGDNIYATKDLEMRGMRGVEVIKVHYLASTGIKSEMDLDVDEELEIKTGKPQIKVISYERNSKYICGELPDTRYVLYLPTSEIRDLE